eukprot:TRINITY_DN16123_c0_g1_i2.p1 TRINITY_DN16123_c0_g1~~TRINITY_DN16123_c0_g1_i2.p1  ORF type:complete len:501 (-),score=51.47 TRINITY_DN16123_c0_g1_i2:83-1366(-)
MEPPKVTKGEIKPFIQDCPGREDSPECRFFGVHDQDWNLSNPAMLAMHAARGRLCIEDESIWRKGGWPPSSPCGRSALCKKVDGKFRLTWVRISLTRREIELVSELPHLFALSIEVGSARDLDLSDLSLPASLRVVDMSIDHHGGFDSVRKMAELLRVHGLVRSLKVQGNQDLKHWEKIDLAEFCGLDLLHFAAYVLNVGHIPPCWNRMRNLQSFYCTNCMMVSAPTALRGLKSLRSFVAFRQSEMTPCVMKDVIEATEGICRASWETVHDLKGGRRESTGKNNDFQEGPSYLCAESSYAFPFKDIVDLGWSNIRKVWLDGNFLTGSIPEYMAESWPFLQSLDLYDNHMDGRLPESLDTLDFIKLQLQGNNFSGTIPKRIVRKAIEGTLILGVASNPSLGGCFPAGLSVDGHGLGRTKIVECSNDEL